MYIPLAILSLFAFLYSIFAGRIEKTPFSGALLFIAFGVAVGPLGLGWLNMEVTTSEFRILADLTLALLLFCDAANTDKSALRRGAHLPLRMLLIGLPGSIFLGFVAGWLIFDGLSIWALAILATMLAATDAALGKAVVSNKAIPIRIRTALSVESGLNDGLCVPILLLFITMATTATSSESVHSDTGFLAITLVAKELGIGILIGIVLTFLSVWLADTALKRGWITAIWGKIPVTMIALGCFAIAQSLHGSGYIAAYVGGLTFGYMAKKKTHALVLDTEGVGETLGMVTWVLFGSVVIGTVIDALSWQALIYALLSLTLVRMLPVMISLIGTKEKIESKLFLAWFGPNGLASIVFAVIVLNSAVPGAELLAMVVTCTVVLSAIAHGVSANPLAEALGKRLKRKRKKRTSRRTAQ